jgi:hypothetical protein
VNVRRSKRTTPSLYRDKGEQEKSSSPEKTGEEKNKFLMIRGLFWNIRGTSKKGSGPFVRYLLQEKKYDFVCV